MAININGTGSITGLSSISSPTISGGSVPLGDATAPGIVFSGDPNTGIYSPGADQVAISTNSTQRLLIDASGNVNIDSNTLYVDATNNRVGIGTSSPAQRLHVSGSNAGGFQVTNADNSDAISLFVRGGNPINSTTDNAVLHVGQRSDVSIITTGRVGIGTTAPGMKLTINDLTTAQIQLGYNDSIYGRIGRNSSGNYEFSSYENGGNLLFGTTGTTGSTTERARIDSSGRLLVGTSSTRTIGYWDTPQFLLEGTDYQKSSLCIYNNQNEIYGAVLSLGHSRGTSVGSNTILQNNDFIGAIAFHGSDGGNEVHAGQIAAYVDGTPGVNDMPCRLVFSTTADGASSPTERMRISANGETTFYSSVNTLLGLRIGEASGWSGNPAIHTSSNVGYIIIRNGTSGGVGLSGGGTSWSSLSDENYKTDLTPITDAATKVRSLRTVTGRYIDDDEDTSRSFLIAQDVEAVLPQAVSTADSGQKLLSYTDTIPLLTAALKEALGKIETLEAKVAALESV